MVVCSRTNYCQTSFLFQLIFHQQMNFNGVLKLYFAHYLHVIFIILNTGLFKSALFYLLSSRRQVLLFSFIVLFVCYLFCILNSVYL